MSLGGTASFRQAPWSIIAIAVLGLVLAVALGIFADQIARGTVALPSTNLELTDSRLAPEQAVTRAKPTPKTSGTRRTTPTPKTSGTRRTTPATTTKSTTTARATTTEAGDDHGGRHSGRGSGSSGSGSSGSGSGSGSGSDSGDDHPHAEDD